MTIEPPLTRRGLAVVGIATGAFIVAMLHGARSLNAVVLPAVVALVAAGAQLYTQSPPTIRREIPTDVTRGETVSVTLHVDTADSFPGTVADTLPSAVTGEAVIEAVIGTEPITYDATFRDRGEIAIGPVTVTARDVLGLLQRRFVIDETETIVVYPHIHALTSTARRTLVALGDTGRRPEREEFTHLREYEHGDTLRDVNWKASAKRDDLIVTEYAAEHADEPVTILAGGTDADAMADATATLATTLIEAGVPVRLETPAGTVDVTDEGGQRRVLEHLARVGAGPVPTRPGDGDLVVRADATETTVRLGTTERPFSSLVQDSTHGSIETDEETKETVRHPLDEVISA